MTLDGDPLIALLFALGLFALLLLLAGAMLWQERRSLTEDVVVYDVEESIEFVSARLSDDSLAAIGPNDVRRILEWEMEYLQRPRRSGRKGPAVVGGVDAATYAQEQSYAAGYSYDGDVVLEVLALQAEYLQSIGAVAEPAEED